MSKEVFAKFHTQSLATVQLVEETLTDGSRVYDLEVHNAQTHGTCAPLITLYHCPNIKDACRQFDVLRATIGQDSTIPASPSIQDDVKKAAALAGIAFPDLVKQPTKPDFEEALEAFVAKAQKLFDDYMAANFPSLPREEITIRNASAPRYIALDKRGSVYCFVDRTNGDILKAASWKAPAKHARGNIYAADGGLSAIEGGRHIRYL